MIISNSHGNPTYGYKGGVGKKGDDGPSIYYTPYDSSTEADSIVDIINSSDNSLSNNPNYKESVVYNINDIIIDTYGSISIIVEDDGDKTIQTIGQIIPKNEKTPSKFKDCSAIFITGSESSFTIDNIYNYLGSDCSSNLIHHRDTRRDKTPIEKIQISKSSIIDIVSDDAKTTDIQFIIIFPDGFIFKKRLDKSSSVYKIDVDCRYIYERIKKNDEYYTLISNIYDEYTYNQSRSTKLQNFIKTKCKSYIEFNEDNLQYRVKVNYY